MADAISVTEGTAAAFDFLKRAWLRTAGALALTSLMMTASVAAVLVRDLPAAGGLILAYVVAAVMAQGALFRIVLSERRASAQSASAGWSGLQWGQMEWRLLAVTLLRAALFTLLVALLLTVMAALYIGLSAARSGHAVGDVANFRGPMDPLISMVLSSTAIAGAIGLSWVGIRVFLAFAATAILGRVQLLSTWPLTRGHAWSILGSLILVSAPMILAASAIRAGRVLLSVRFEEHPANAAVLGLIMGVSHAFLVLPLSVGLMAYLYDRLGPAPAGAS